MWELFFKTASDDFVMQPRPSIDRMVGVCSKSNLLANRSTERPFLHRAASELIITLIKEPANSWETRTVSELF